MPKQSFFLPVTFIIRKFFIIFFIFINVELFNASNLYSEEVKVDDYGIISLMYHRFDENKYPSTNIRMNIFKEQMDLIKKNEIQFVNPYKFENYLNNLKRERKILLTIDDAFSSFYLNAWPYLKKNKIPFILFVSTREIGKNGYMTWDQLREINKFDFVYIGNHSHSHEYLVDENKELIIEDLVTSINLLKNELNIKPIFFSYPFGEYSNEFKKIVRELNFKYAFGQHSGVIDETKNDLELPRFPINEKYGEISRFKTLLKTLPFKYKSIQPEERYLVDSENPPKVKVVFYENINNLKSINCFSNEEDKWRNSSIKFMDNNTLLINLSGKFITERGRINCSLREQNGFFRWLGIQYVIADR